MLYDDLTDVPIEVFGGYSPAIVPANLPPGAANVAQDVMFPQAGVRSRGGLQNYVFTGTNLPDNASINGLKSYITPSGGQRLLIWDSLGDLYKEDPQGTLELIMSRPYGGLFYQSQSMFGREYQAFFNSLGGFDIPRQYDDTNWDRVSHSGPGSSPAVADLSFPIVAITRDADTGVITVTIAAVVGMGGMAPGKLLNIAGVIADATLNGQFPIASITIGVTAVIKAWGAFGSYAISSLSRDGAGTVTAVLEQTPNVTTSETIIVGGVEDSSFDGEFEIATISGNVVTWAQAGSQTISAGGTLYVENFSAPVILGFGSTDSSPSPGVILAGDQQTEFVVGGTITISGNTQSAFNSTFVISNTAYYPPGSSQAEALGALQGITYINFNTTFSADAGYGGTATASLPASDPAATGTVGLAGNISQGLHNVSVAFINRQGYITKGAPPKNWNAGGGFVASVSDIATGPPNIAQRLLLFTPAISPPATMGTFYSLPTGSTSLSQLAVMLIPDNVTTVATVDFSDTILISGFQAQYLFNELELGECAAMLGYNARTVWLGERARVPNFVNLGFDGGWDVIDLIDFGPFPYPRGWTHTTAGQQSALALGLTADWGDALAIVGKNTPVPSLLTQSAYQDYLGVAIIQTNTSYSVRVRLAAANGLNAGTLHINLKSTLQGFQTAGLSVPASALTAKYQEFIFPLTDAPLANPPTDLTLQLYADGTPNLGGVFLIDSIEPFPTNTPSNSSTARFSYAFNPEGVDAVTGQVQVRPGDGQSLRAGFPLRNNLYLAKDHYLGYVTDDGVNEPASWSFNEVSATIGICGPNAVDWNEEWAVFAERAGLHICWGSDPVKITPEIQSDASDTGRISWASINWAYGFTIWVRIDKVNKMVLVGAPVNGATSPNMVFMMDYRWLDSAEDIAGSPLVGYSSFTGKILGHGRGRRWALWNITANSMCFAERTDGTAQPFFGNGLNNGVLSEQVDPAVQAYDDFGEGGAIAPATLGLSQVGNLVTVVMALGYGVDGSSRIGGPITIAGSPIAGYNGTFVVAGQGTTSIGIEATTYYTFFNPQSGLEPTGGGAATFFGIVASQYQSYASPSAMEEQQYQLRAHRKLLGYLKFRALGTGTLNLAATTAQRSTLLRGYTLSLNPVGDGERPLNIHGERFFLTVNTTAVGSWFQLEKLIPCMKKDATALVRGVSA